MPGRTAPGDMSCAPTTAPCLSLKQNDHTQGGYQISRIERHQQAITIISGQTLAEGNSGQRSETSNRSKSKCKAVPAPKALSHYDGW